MAFPRVGYSMWLGVLAAAPVFHAGQLAAAGEPARFSTNYYQVSGATWDEVHKSIVRSRPWKTNQPMDARTDWTVRWKFSVVDFGDGARVRSFDVETTITVTLPSWKAPADASKPLLEGWKRYFDTLKRHEGGHVVLALQAAAAVRKHAGAVTEAPSAQELTRQINQAANKVIDQFREKDKEYDRITQHGMKQDAWRP
jgi:predicted secreted Zn-dependent protease